MHLKENVTTGYNQGGARRSPQKRSQRLKGKTVIWKTNQKPKGGVGGEKWGGSAGGVKDWPGKVGYRRKKGKTMRGIFVGESIGGPN